MEGIKAGDRVEVVDEAYGIVEPGSRGKVVFVRGIMIGVELDKEFLEGHDCDGLAKDGHGWYFFLHEFKVIEE